MSYHTAWGAAGEGLLALGIVFATLVASDAIANSNGVHLADAGRLETLSSSSPAPEEIEFVTGSSEDYPVASTLAQQIIVASIAATREPPNLPVPVTATSVREPFGIASEKMYEGTLWNKWRTVEAAIRLEIETLVGCRADAHDCPAFAQRFLAIVEAARSRAGRARLGEVNRAINLAIRPTSDVGQHGVPDRWTAPLATFAAGRGDCEDYAIAKYVALREAGVAAEDLRLLVVRDIRRSENHMMLAARLDERWLTLDNRRLLLLEDREVTHVIPLFSLDNSSVRRFAFTESTRVPPRDRAAAMPIAVSPDDTSRDANSARM